MFLNNIPIEYIHSNKEIHKLINISEFKYSLYLINFIKNKIMKLQKIKEFLY